MSDRVDERHRARVHSLDSLRGLAALAVVLHHCLYTITDRPRWIAFSPLRLIDAGGQGAVLVFFALSGFVLFLTFNRDDRWNLTTFIVKRISRIYIPFVISILASAFLCFLVQPVAVPYTSDWFRSYIWAHPLSIRHILDHFWMSDADSRQDLNNVMWSLVHELRISLIFPAIAWFVQRSWLVSCCVAAVISTAAAVHWSHRSVAPAFDLVATARYLFLFVAGATMALHAQMIRGLVAGVPRAALVIIWLFAIAMITVPEAHLAGWVTTFAAVTLVALSFADAPVDRLLTVPALLWLGRVSYSLYLFHLIVLATLVHLLGRNLPLLIVLILVVPTSLLAAQVGNVYVERRAISLGRDIAARLSKKEGC